MNISVRLVGLGKTLPEYQTTHSAAMDLRAAISTPLTLKPLNRAIVPTGIAMALPDGYEAQVRARSGNAIKYGICMANGVGTIDADYRGEIGAILINLGTDNFVINPGDRIAQMVIAKIERVQWQAVEELPETDRGQGGFGSTGK